MIKNSVFFFQTTKEPVRIGAKQRVQIGCVALKGIEFRVRRHSACVHQPVRMLQIEEAAPGLVEGQDADIGSRTLQICLRQAKVGADQHPLDAGPGVALGFGGGDDRLDARFRPAGAHEAPPQLSF